jgi:hypothetical protein
VRKKIFAGVIDGHLSFSLHPVPGVELGMGYSCVRVVEACRDVRGPVKRLGLGKVVGLRESSPCLPG